MTMETVAEIKQRIVEIFGEGSGISLKGGPGSGYSEGHRGIPGHHGGSLPREGGKDEELGKARIFALEDYDVDFAVREVPKSVFLKLIGDKPIEITEADREELGSWLKTRLPIPTVDPNLTPNDIDRLFQDALDRTRIPLLSSAIRNYVQTVISRSRTRDGDFVRRPAPVPYNPSHVILPTEMGRDPWGFFYRDFERINVPTWILKAAFVGPEANPLKAAKLGAIVDEYIQDFDEARLEAVTDAQRRERKTRNKAMFAEDGQALLDGTKTVSRDEAVSDPVYNAPYQQTLKSAKKDPARFLPQSVKAFDDRQAIIDKLKAGELETLGNNTFSGAVKTVHDLFVERELFRELANQMYRILKRRERKLASAAAQVEAMKNGQTVAALTTEDKALIRNYAEAMEKITAHPAHHAQNMAIEVEQRLGELHNADFTREISNLEFTLGDKKLKVQASNLDPNKLPDLVRAYAVAQAKLSLASATKTEVDAFDERRNRPTEDYPVEDGTRAAIALYRLRNDLPSVRAAFMPLVTNPAEGAIVRQYADARENLRRVVEPVLNSTDLTVLQASVREIDEKLTALSAEATQYRDTMAELEGGIAPPDLTPREAALHFAQSFISYDDALYLRARLMDKQNEIRSRQQEQRNREEQARQEAQRAERERIAALSREERAAEYAAHVEQVAKLQKETLAKLAEKGIRPESIETMDGVKKIIEEKAATTVIRAVTPLISDEDYEERIFRRGGGIDACDSVLQQVSGTDTLSAADFIQTAFEYYDSKTDIRAEVDYARYQSAYVWVHGHIYNEDGREVGYFERSLYPDGHIDHDHFEIEGQYQQNGFGSRFYRNAERAYVAAGFKRINIYANLGVGGYSWARMGFVTDRDSTFQSLKEGIRELWADRYEGDEDFPKRIKQVYEIAALTGPDGHDIGHEFLLGSSWQGHKILDDNDDGFTAGLLYYAAKAEEARSRHKELGEISQIMKIALKGGPGSGYSEGHRGIPGHHGGSLPREAGPFPMGKGEIVDLKVRDHIEQFRVIPVDPKEGARLKDLLYHPDTLEYQPTAADRKRLAGWLDELFPIPPAMNLAMTTDELQAEYDSIKSDKIYAAVYGISGYLSNARYEAMHRTNRLEYTQTTDTIDHIILPYKFNQGDRLGFFSSWSSSNFLPDYLMDSLFAGDKANLYDLMILRKILKERYEIIKKIKHEIGMEVDQRRAREREEARYGDIGRALLAGTATISPEEALAEPDYQYQIDYYRRQLRRKPLEELHARIANFEYENRRIKLIQNGDTNMMGYMSGDTSGQRDETVRDVFIKREIARALAKEAFGVLKAREEKVKAIQAKLQALEAGEDIQPRKQEDQDAIQAFQAKYQEITEHPSHAESDPRYEMWSVQRDERNAIEGLEMNNIQVALGDEMLDVTASALGPRTMLEKLDNLIVARKKLEVLQRASDAFRQYYVARNRPLEEYKWEPSEMNVVKIFREERDSSESGTQTLADAYNSRQQGIINQGQNFRDKTVESMRSQFNQDNQESMILAMNEYDRKMTDTRHAINRYRRMLEEVEGGVFENEHYEDVLNAREALLHWQVERQNLVFLKQQRNAVLTRVNQLRDEANRRWQAKREAKNAARRAEEARLAAITQAERIAEQHARYEKAKIVHQETLARLAEKGIQPEMVNTIEGVKKLVKEEAATAAIKAVTLLDSSEEFERIHLNGEKAENANRILQQVSGTDTFTAADFIDTAFNFTDTHTGLTAKVTQVMVYSTSIEVIGNVRSANGERAGDWKRTINQDGTIEHNLLDLERKYQKGGFGAAFYWNSERAYIAAGFKRVTVHANLKVGGYTWARLGFHANSDYTFKGFLDTAKSIWGRRYSDPFPDGITEIFHLAALRGPDGRKIGSEVLLNQDWYGHKNLDDRDDGFVSGLLYYAAKTEEHKKSASKERRELSRIVKTAFKGGPGSGFEGHLGRPGKQGGSLPRSGAQVHLPRKHEPTPQANPKALAMGLVQHGAYHIAPQVGATPARPPVVDPARLRELELARKVHAKISPSMYEVSLGARRAILLSDGQVMWSEHEQYHTPMFARLILEHEVDWSSLDRSTRNLWKTAIERAKQVIENDTIEDTILEGYAKELLNATSIEWLARGDYDDETLSHATKPYFRAEGKPDATEAEMRYLFRRVQRMFERGILSEADFDTIEITGGGARGEFLVDQLDEIAGIRKLHIPDSRFWEWETILKEVDQVRRRLSTSFKGGPGSGFRGHRGRPGHQGGSLPKGVGEAGEASPVLNRATKYSIYEPNAMLYARQATRYTPYASAEEARKALIESTAETTRKLESLIYKHKRMEEYYHAGKVSWDDYSNDLKESLRERRKLVEEQRRLVHEFLDGMRAETPLNIQPQYLRGNEFARIVKNAIQSGQLTRADGTPFKDSEIPLVMGYFIRRYCLASDPADPAQYMMRSQIDTAVNAARSYIEERQFSDQKGREVRLGGDKEGKEGYYTEGEDYIIGMGVVDENLLQYSIFHELGHWFSRHSADPNLQTRVYEFYTRRTQGEQEEEYKPGSGVMVKKDKWIDAYMGRNYGDKETEVLSGGFELFFTNTLKFATLDPEHFDFVVSILRGIPET